MPITIRAISGPVESLYITDAPKPVSKEGQALVRVKAFGINRPDIIEKLGEDSEPSFKTGDAVFALAYGASGVSISGIQLVLGAGAWAVYATARSQEKCDFIVNALGATTAFNATDPSCLNPETPKIAASEAKIVCIGLMSGFTFDKQFGMGLFAFKRTGDEGSTLRSRDEEFQRKVRDIFVSEALPKFFTEDSSVYIERVLPWNRSFDAHMLMETNQITDKVI
ncbi:putative quinone oxidoreductase [Trichoderma novae-zelandiae]